MATNTGGPLSLNKNASSDTVASALLTAQNANMDKINTAIDGLNKSIDLFQSGMVNLTLTANTEGRVEVTFRRPFSAVPSVVVSHSGNSYKDLDLQTVNVSTTGFEVVGYCATFANLYVHWVAMRRTQ